MRLRSITMAVLMCALMPLTARAQVLYLFPETESGYDVTCNLVTTSVGMYQVAVVYSGGYVSSFHFGVHGPSPSFAPIQYASPYTITGSYFSDLTVDVGSCQFVTVVATLTYLSNGDPVCGRIYVGQAGQDEPTVTACQPSIATFPLGGADMYINSHIVSDGYHGYCTCDPVATSPSTWGQVKALYRN
ncbi:MAG TPA: hypothetical protein VFH88_10445 [Candidatus Krumholzibacteria bacterium]|nr:hypothetical protein [Candidatus Krumholzibacteria bacterium]